MSRRDAALTTTVDHGMAALHVAHGSLPWARLIEPAIEAAQHGFAATHALRHFCEENRHRLEPDALSLGIFLPDGAAPPLGALVRQPALALTLRRLAHGRLRPAARWLGRRLVMSRLLAPRQRRAAPDQSAPCAR